MNAGIVVGLDIGRSSLQAAARPAGQKWVAKTDDAGISEIVSALTSVQPEIIVLEAQGGVELPVAGTLASTGLPLAFVSRRNVREFARSLGASGNRDHAELLAHYAELARPEVRPIPNNVVEQLQALKARQRELMSIIAVERSRLNTRVTAVQRNIQNHIYFLEKNFASLGTEIDQTLRSSSIWQ